MRLNAPNIKLSELAPPLRLYRDNGQNSALNNSTNSLASNSNRTGSLYGPSTKRKTQIIDHVEDEEEKRIKQEEIHPWILDDSEDKSFVGRLEGGQTANYVLLVNQGNNFHVLPVHKWFIFKPKIQYKTLSLEEAEKSMSSRGKFEENRWFMRSSRQKDEAAVYAAEEISLNSSEKSHLLDGIRDSMASANPRSNTVKKLKVSSGAALSLDQNYYSKIYDETDLDYDMDNDIFQDDEGAESQDTFDQDERTKKAKFSEKISVEGDSLHKKSSNLSEYGKELKKIIKHTNDRNSIVYFSEDDENADPYASEEEELTQAMTPNQAYSSGRFASRPSSVDFSSEYASQTSSGDKTSASNLLLSSPMRAKTPLVSDNALTTSANSPAAVSEVGGPLSFQQSAPSSDPSIITESQIINLLKQGPTTAKDLIFAFRNQIRQQPSNKEAIRIILKKIAVIKDSPVGSGNSIEVQKLLELKDEYKILLGLSN